MNDFASMGLPVEDTARMPIIHPSTGVPLVDDTGRPAWIDLLHTDSAAAQAYERTITKARLSQRVRAVPTPEQIEEEHCGRLAAVTRGWHLVPLAGGPALEVPFSAEAAARLYRTNSMRWLREQVETFIAARANFTKASSPS